MSFFSSEPHARILRQRARLIYQNDFAPVFQSERIENKRLYWDELIRVVGPSAPINYLEFGIYKGKSLKYFTDRFAHPDSKFLGFDSFEGLPEDWAGKFTKGSFGLGGSIPEIEDGRVSFFKGCFQNTLTNDIKSFFSQNGDAKTIVNIDSDLYSSALFVLTWCWNNLSEYSLTFDEFSVHECLAFFDFLNAFPNQYEFLFHTISPQSNLPVNVCLKVKRINYS